MSNTFAVIILPCGPCVDTILDTAESIDYYCSEPHEVVFINDFTSDGTYEKLTNSKRHNWHIIRNSKRNGYDRLVQTLCHGYSYIYNNLQGSVVLKLDTDALLIRSGVLTDALEYMNANPNVGLFGVYDVDYNRPRSFLAHKKQISRETSWYRSIFGIRPYWIDLLHLAEARGYTHGENVFGGAYFMTWPCLSAIKEIGGLSVPYHSHSRLAEDVYFSMATIAAGYKLGHFAAPSGPLCLEFRGLPYPAKELWEKGYKIIHSVDKGPNTGPIENDGYTARDYFRSVREKESQFGK